MNPLIQLLLGILGPAATRAFANQHIDTTGIEDPPTANFPEGPSALGTQPALPGPPPQPALGSPVQPPVDDSFQALLREIRSINQAETPSTFESIGSQILPAILRGISTQAVTPQRREAPGQLVDIGSGFKSFVPGSEIRNEVNPFAAGVASQLQADTARQEQQRQLNAQSRKSQTEALVDAFKAKQGIQKVVIQQEGKQQLERTKQGGRENLEVIKQQGRETLRNMIEDAKDGRFGQDLQQAASQFAEKMDLENRKLSEKIRKNQEGEGIRRESNQIRREEIQNRKDRFDRIIDQKTKDRNQRKTIAEKELQFKKDQAFMKEAAKAAERLSLDEMLMLSDVKAISEELSSAGIFGKRVNFDSNRQKAFIKLIRNNVPFKDAVKQVLGEDAFSLTEEGAIPSGRNVFEEVIKDAIEKIKDERR